MKRKINFVHQQTLLKKCAHLLLTQYIKEQNTEGRKRVKGFLHILTDEYGTAISRSAIECKNKHIDLPLNEDIRLLNQY